MLCHLLRQVGCASRENRGFVSIARPSVAVMSRSTCLCTDLAAAFEVTQGDLVLQLELLCLVVGAASCVRSRSPQCGEGLA